MSEEEKEAIELLKEYLNNIKSSNNRINSQYNDNYGYVTLQFTKWGNNDLEAILNLTEKQEKVIDAIKNKLEKHIKFCEQEARGHLDNKMCYISLGFDKSLLEIINRKVDNNE